MPNIKNVIAPLLGLLSLFATTHVLRADIVQPNFELQNSWPDVTEVVGQSFTADNSVTSLVSIGFFYRDSNTSLSPPSITMDLFVGSGYSGILLDSDTVIATIGTGDHWEDFDFSGNLLVPGQQYSLRLTAGPAAGGYSVQRGDDYPAGAWLDSTGGPASDVHGQEGDLAFRVQGVPEPSSIALAAFALIALTAARRNWRRH